MFVCGLRFLKIMVLNNYVLIILMRYYNKYLMNIFLRAKQLEYEKENLNINLLNINKMIA